MLTKVNSSFVVSCCSSVVCCLSSVIVRCSLFFVWSLFLTCFVECGLLWLVCGLLRVDYVFACRSLFFVRCLLVVCLSVDR